MCIGHGLAPDLTKYVSPINFYLYANSPLFPARNLDNPHVGYLGNAVSGDVGT